MELQIAVLHAGITNSKRLRSGVMIFYFV